jgi:hypothetical protein
MARDRWSCRYASCTNDKSSDRLSRDCRLDAETIRED